MDDAYNLLVRNKRKDESFSEEIRRITARKGNIMDCVGLWSDISDKDAEDMKKAIKQFRRDSTKSLSRRIENL